MYLGTVDVTLRVRCLLVLVPQYSSKSCTAASGRMIHNMHCWE